MANTDEILRRILRTKQGGHLLHEAIKPQEQREKAETIKERKKRIAEQQSAEASRKGMLDEIASIHKRVDTQDIEGVKAQLHRNTVVEAKNELSQAISSPSERGRQTGYEHSFYVFQEYVGQPASQQALNSLMDDNPKVAEAIYELAEKNSKVHNNAGELFRIARTLYVNTPDLQKDVIEPILSQISNKVKVLINRDIKVQIDYAARNEQNLNERDAKRGILEKVVRESSSILHLTDEQKEEIEHGNSEVLDELLTSDYRPEGEITPSEGVIGKALPIKFVRDINRIWEEFEDAERNKTELSVEKLEHIKREIYRAESENYPSDIMPNSTAYLNTVNDIRDNSEKKLNLLAAKLKDRLEREGPQYKSGITGKEEFFKRMEAHPGFLGQYLHQNPEMYDLFIGTGKESYKFRNQIFLRIHNSVITQRRESSNDNFGLYERADFTSFTSILKSGMPDIKVKETGATIGQTWVDYYTGLSNTIRHSRDIDFWTSQPGATMEQLQRSMIMFQNEYTAQALSIPAVTQAFRAYETALTSIRDGNDGYIPPGYIDYDAVRMTSDWDDSAENLLTKMIALGVVKDAARDYDRMGGKPLVSDDGVSLKLDKNPFTGVGRGIDDVDPLELKMYMTLAKGFGMVSMRLPEIIANSKIPGTDVPGFRSPAMEGIITALNHWNVFVKKWKQYTYKYFYMINMLLPQDKKLPVGEGAAEAVYRARLEGTLEEKYGKDAATMLDAFNFSKTHGALGPTTTWRTLDSSIGWTDKQRELLGGPTRILLAGRLAGEDRIKEAFIEAKYKEEFRERKRKAGQAAVGAEFEALWLSEGKAIYGKSIDREWLTFKHHHKAEIDIISKNLQRVYKSRIWIETAMRNPLAIAHHAYINIPIAGYEGEEKIDKFGKYRVKRGTEKTVKLHSFIIERVLGISPEELETGTIVNGDATYQINAAKYNSPTKKQREYLADVLNLEGDLAAVREVALEENREMTEKDFRRIISGDENKDTVRSRHAIEYWKQVKKFITGNENLDTESAKKLYEQLGIIYHVDQETGTEMEYYNIDWEKIQHADNAIFKGLRNKNIEFEQKFGESIKYDSPKAFDYDFLDKEWGWYFATDDTDFRKMAFLNLGNRQWVRRGGDVQGHYQGGLAVDEYLDDPVLGPNPDIHKLTEQLLKIRQAYQADSAEIGQWVAGNLAFLTGKLYEFNYKKLGSVAQREVWRTMRNVAGWNANKRREFWDAIEHMGVIPPHAHFEHWSNPFGISDVHKLRKLNHADNPDVWTEIILLGLGLATVMTLWRAFTAKSEEEEGGGGGHH